jgi:hypothetical protein
MGMSKSDGVWNQGSGTSQRFGLLATANSQAAKVAHGKLDPGNSSPIWMTPAQITYSGGAAAHAQSINACAAAIANGDPPPDGCSAKVYARGDTCPPPPVTVNGSLGSDDPHSWKNSGKTPLGQPGGRIGFYYFSSIHGPFYQNSPWDPYVDVPPAVASPGWDPPTQAPSFRGTYLRIYGEPPGQWMVAWGLDATDLQNNNNNPPPPGGPGGDVEGLAFDQIDSVPDPTNCGSGYHVLSDPTGTNSPLTTTVDAAAGGSVAVLAGFIGNVARGTPLATTGNSAGAVLRVLDQGGATVFEQVHQNNPSTPINQWFTAETWSNGCANWQAGLHYAAHNVLSTGDVALVSAADAPNVRCYIEGIAGDWSKWRSDGAGGSIQPFAQIYFDANTGYRLKVWPAADDKDAVRAYASCIFLKK